MTKGKEDEKGELYLEANMKNSIEDVVNSFNKYRYNGRPPIELGFEYGRSTVPAQTVILLLAQ